MPGLGGERERVFQVLQRIPGRERPLGIAFRQHGLWPWLRSAKLSAEPLLSASSSTAGSTPLCAADRQRLGDRATDLEQHHVVHELRHLAATDPAAVQNVAGKAAQIRLDAREDRGIGADHDTKLAALGGKAGARHRRIGIGDALRRELSASSRVRSTGAVERSTSTLPCGMTPSSRLADLGKLRPARQRQEQHGGIPRDVLGRSPRPQGPVCQARERLRPQIEAATRAAGLSQQIGADRLAHHAKADAADRGLRPLMRCAPSEPARPTPDRRAVRERTRAVAARGGQWPAI